MGFLDAIFGGGSSTSADGYNKIVHGDLYLVCTNVLDDSVICYTSGIANTSSIIEKYLKKEGILDAEVEMTKVYYKKKDVFLKENSLKMICIVDTDVFIKEEIIDIIPTELKADKRNRFMRGLAKYTRK